MKKVCFISEQGIGRTTVCYFWSRLQLQSLQTVTRAQWWPPTIFFIIFLFGENWNFGCPHETEARRPTACNGSPCNQKGVQCRHWVSCDAKLNTKPRTKIGIALSLGLSGCLVPLTLVFMSVLQCDTKCFSIGKSFIWKRHYKLWTPKTKKKWTALDIITYFSHLNSTHRLDEITKRQYIYCTQTFKQLLWT